MRTIWPGVLALLAALTGCHMPFWTPPGPTPTRISPSDRASGLAGTWSIELFVDSTSGSRPVRFATGTLALTDTIIKHGPPGLKGSVHITFDTLVYRATCFDSGDNVFPVTWRRDSIWIDLTPNWNDCGLVVRGRLANDSLRGRWMYPQYGGPFPDGPMAMVRTKGQ
jgi:hypothetical protein